MVASRARFAVPVFVAVLVLSTLAPALPAQLRPLVLIDSVLDLRPQWVQYAVKFVCGEPERIQEILAQGRYYTAINVHNPELQRPVDFWFKVAVAFPGLEVGPISRFQNVSMPADGALEIDCPTLRELAGQERFAKGFAVLLSPRELDVVAVYTASRQPGTVDDVRTLHMERVPPRPVRGDPRLVLQGGEEPAACRGAGCCCITPRSLRFPEDGLWPACADGFECRALEPGGVVHPTAGIVDVNVCVPVGAGPTAPFIRSTEPSFCRIDLR